MSRDVYLFFFFLLVTISLSDAFFLLVTPPLAGLPQGEHG